MSRIRKLVGAVLGGITAGAVVAVGGLLGWQVEPELAAAIVVVFTAVATYLAPANELPT
jgi:hypothetical protein